jgi:ubiquinone/menaquinone biosynthesis C-methylase UbiE
MMADPRIAFFDGIAERWDGWEDLPALDAKLALGLVEMGICGSEKILDIGCGTGNLTRALLKGLSPLGQVTAVDISPAMIRVARRKLPYASRVNWYVADARRLPLPDDSMDRAFCCSVWPHFVEPVVVAAELGRVLRPGGHLHVWHLMGRDRVNEIHASAGEAVQHDILRPASETASLLRQAGFDITTCRDDQEQYLVTGVWTPKERVQ